MVDVLSSVVESEGAGRFPAGSSVDVTHHTRIFGGGSSASWAVNPERPTAKEAAKTAMERVQAERRAYCQARATEQSFPSSPRGADNAGVWLGHPTASGAAPDIPPQQHFAFQPPRIRPSSAHVPRSYGTTGGLRTGDINDTRMHYAEPQQTAAFRPRRPASARPGTARSQRYNEIAAKLAERRARTRADLAATRQKISELRSHVMSLMPGSRMPVENGQSYYPSAPSANPVGDAHVGLHVEAQTAWDDAQRVEYVPERLSHGSNFTACVQPSGAGLAAVRAVSRHRHDIAEQVAAERQAYIASHLNGKLPVSSDGVSTAVGSDVASGGGDWSSCSGPEPVDRVDRRRRPTSAKPVLCTGPHVLERSADDFLDTDDIGLGWVTDSQSVPVQQSREAARAALAAERAAFVGHADRTGHTDGRSSCEHRVAAGPIAGGGVGAVEGTAALTEQFAPAPAQSAVTEYHTAGGVPPCRPPFGEDRADGQLTAAPLDSALPPLRPPSPGAPGALEYPPASLRSSPHRPLPFDSGAGVGDLGDGASDTCDGDVHAASAQEARKLMAQTLAADREAFICKGLNESVDTSSPIPGPSRPGGHAAGSSSKLARLAEEREAFLAARKT
mmetsp:Transcript_46683/g.123344  ORF Transcript_46683/g.123344 Transcript_46683/m.123344 type:complete len:617 (-) Transcript_46683:182-2032(-)